MLYVVIIVTITVTVGAIPAGSALENQPDPEYFEKMMPVEQKPKVILLLLMLLLFWLFRRTSMRCVISSQVDRATFLF